MKTERKNEKFPFSLNTKAEFYRYGMYNQVYSNGLC